MIGNKRSLAVENLVRYLMSIALVIIVLFILKSPAEAILNSLFGSNLEDSFNEFVQEINNLKNPKEVFVNLDPGTAIIGFSSTAKEFRCFGCGIDTTDIVSFFKKPSNEQCNNKPCVCLCPKGLQLPDTSGNPPYEMKCEKISCRTLSKGLVEVIELRKYIEKLEKTEQIDYSKLKNAKWIDGFLYERLSRSDFVSNGLPQQRGSRFTVFVTQENSGNDAYLIVCPGQECTYSIHPDEANKNLITELPSNICEIMYTCINTQNIRKVLDVTGVPEKFCRLNRPITRYHSQEECEKVQSCVKSSQKVNAPGKCEKQVGFYELSFLT